MGEILPSILKIGFLSRQIDGEPKCVENTHFVAPFDGCGFQPPRAVGVRCARQDAEFHE
jgi:hypothetical protein